MRKSAPMCESRCVRRMPAARARSTWARSSRSASSGRARGHRRLQEREVAVGVEQARHRVHRAHRPPAERRPLAVSARWMPRSASGCARAKRATSGNHGQGTRMLADVTQPCSRASKVARLTQWAMPRSSAWMISSRALGGMAQRSCTALRGRDGATDRRPPARTAARGCLISRDRRASRKLPAEPRARLVRPPQQAAPERRVLAQRGDHDLGAGGEIRSTTLRTSCTSDSALRQERAAQHDQRGVDARRPRSPPRSPMRTAVSVHGLARAPVAVHRRLERAGHPVRGVAARGAGPALGQALQAGQRLQAAAHAGVESTYCGPMHMNAISPAMKWWPRWSSPSIEDAGADAGAHEDEAQVSWPRAAPRQCSPSMARFTSFSTMTGTPSARSRMVAHGHARPALQVGGEVTMPVVAVHGARRARPHRHQAVEAGICASRISVRSGARDAREQRLGPSRAGVGMMRCGQALAAQVGHRQARARGPEVDARRRSRGAR